MHRILYLIPSLSPSGTTTQLSLLANGLPRDEFEIHVAALSADNSPAPSRLRLSGIESLVIGRRSSFDPIAFYRLKQHIQRLQPALVQTWETQANGFGRAAALAAGVRQLVATVRHVNTRKTQKSSAFDRWLATRTAKFVVNSDALQEHYQSRGVPSEKITLIPAGVAPTATSPLTRSALLAQHNLPADAKIMVCLGPLTKHKRLKELIWATDQLKAVEVPAHLFVVGDGPMRQRWERFARLNRVSERVHFLGHREDASPWLASADVLWQAAPCEGQSYAILEAMAAGVPVVAADAPGNRELVISGATGYLVPLGERAGFARYTLPLLEDAALAGRLGMAGRALAQQEHSLATMLQQYADLYRQLLS